MDDRGDEWMTFFEGRPQHLVVFRYNIINLLTNAMQKRKMHNKIILYQFRCFSCAKTTLCRTMLKRTIYYDNQDDAKQDYLLMHFPEKKEKNGLKK